MDADFWRLRWRDGQTGWRQATAHPMLARHFPALGVAPGARVFVPFCGDSVDVGWLLAAGCRVAGAELVESAVQRLFENFGVEPRVESLGALKRYAGEGIDVFVGNLFDLAASDLGAVDAVYDRAALVALPAETRPAYAAHVTALAGRAPQLLISFDYDQDRMPGPPFSVPDGEVRTLYGADYDLEKLESAEVEGGLKGLCPASETAWRLKPAA